MVVKKTVWGKRRSRDVIRLTVVPSLAMQSRLGEKGVAELWEMRHYLGTDQSISGGYMVCACTALMKTKCNLGATLARLTVGLVMLPHGLQKTIGAFGGFGFSGTMELFTTKLGLAWIVAFLVIMAESVGALAIILGFMTRFCAASLAIVMVGAVFMAHLQHGFFMNWFGQQQGEGFEYHLLVIGICLSLVVTGGGAFSIDRALSFKAGTASGSCCG